MERPVIKQIADTEEDLKRLEEELNEIQGSFSGKAPVKGKSVQ